MNAAMIDDLVKSLGRTYPELIASGMYLPGGPPRGIFEDSDTRSMSLAPGIELEFSASTQRFEALYISLLELFPGKPTYKGGLPYELKSRMTQNSVNLSYGEPLESKAPYKMPVLGMTGGWDAYRFPNMPKNMKMMFRYNADMEVYGVVFYLN